MKGELVATTTADRVRLNGFLLAAHGHAPSGPDGVVILHGLAGNFYGSSLLQNLGLRLSGLGIHCLLENTRGHDLLNWTTRAGRSQICGSANEDVTETTHDFRAWTEYLLRQGCHRVLWMGHSLGGIKALYSAAYDPHDALVGIAALSPTRLNFEQFAASDSREVFLGTIAEARRLVTAGEGATLMNVPFPFATWMTAEAYLAKYGPENRLDWFRFADRVRVPTWIAFGELEIRDHPAFMGLDGAIRHLIRDLPHFQFEVVTGADHFYIACNEKVGDRITAWMDGLG